MLVIFSLTIIFSLLFAIIIFWLSGFFTKSKKTRIILSAAIPMVFSPATALFTMFAYLATTTWYHEKEFDKKSWDTDIDQRWMMTGDIINSNYISGKSKNEVLQILGGDTTLNTNRWSYEVGYPPNILNIDPDYLIVEFKNDTVNKVWQRHP